MSKGNPDFFFTIEEPMEENWVDHLKLLPQAIQDITAHNLIKYNNIEMAQNLIETGDDNEPAPENTPTEHEGGEGASYLAIWGHAQPCAVICADLRMFFLLSSKH
jgi:hypothetical protein